MRYLDLRAIDFRALFQLAMKEQFLNRNFDKIIMKEILYISSLAKPIHLRYLYFTAVYSYTLGM